MKYLLIFSICCFSLTVFSQTEIELRTDGIVVPRLDTSNVSSPSIGQVIYDTQTAQLMYYNGVNWMSLNGAFERSGTTVRQKAGYDTDDFVFGRNGLPDTAPIISDEMIFFDQSKGALRGGTVYVGRLDWSEDSLGISSFAYGESPRASGDYGAVALGDDTKATGDYGAIAMGSGTTASGDDGATAAGDNTIASGKSGATAMGRSTTASGDDGATALGQFTEASGGYGATALGERTTASGDDGATALGERTTASGDDGATALGYYSIASGNFGATAIGESCNALGSEGAIAIGVNTTASGNEGAIAIGNESVANGNEGAVAIGFYAKTYGDKGAASIGWRTEANGRGMTVVGMFNDTIVSKGADTSSISPVFIAGNGSSTSSRSNAFAILKNGAIRGGDLSTSTWWNQSFLGNSSFAHGKGVVASGIASSAFGDTAQAVGDASFAMGENTVSAAYASLAIGRYNKGSGTPNSWEDGEALFEIGIGSSNANRVNAVTVNKRGDFHINHSNNVGGGGLKLTNTASATESWRIYLSSDTGVLRFYSDDNGGSATAWIDDVSGAYSSISDGRMKKHTQLIGTILPSVLGLKANSYLYNSQELSEQKTLGFIAQEVAEIFPELVSYNQEEDLYGINYSGFSVVAIKAIQEQQEVIENLRLELEKQRQQNKNHEDRISKLEVQLAALLESKR